MERFEADLRAVVTSRQPSTRDVVVHIEVRHLFSETISYECIHFSVEWQGDEVNWTSLVRRIEGTRGTEETLGEVEGMKARRMGAVAVVCLLIVIGYNLVYDSWVINHTKVTLETHLVFATWLWVLLVVGGMLIGSLGFGSRLWGSLLDREVLLSGILIFLMGTALMAIAVYNQTRSGIAAGGCDWSTQQLVSAALYPAMVSSVGAYLTALGHSMRRVRDRGAPRYGPKATYSAVGVVVAITIAAAVLFAQFTYDRGPPEPCCYMCPDVEMFLRETQEGYEIEIRVDRTEALEAFEVSVFTNDTLWSGFPMTLESTSLGQGPSGEWLNFTDLLSDERLTGGDFFTLENVRPGTRLEVVLIWSLDQFELEREVIDVP